MLGLTPVSLAAVLGLAVSILAVVPPGAAGAPLQTDVSSNWGGYVATGPGSTANTAVGSMSYTDVTGQWVQPKAVCKGGVPTALATGSGSAATA